MAAQLYLLPLSQVPADLSFAAKFDAFWTAYPGRLRNGVLVKSGKGYARTCLFRALRRAPFDAIMGGIDRMKAHTDPDYIPDPSTYLNQDRWENEYDAAAPEGTVRGLRFDG